MVPLFYIDLRPINRMGIQGYSNLSTQSIERRGNSELPVVQSSNIITKVAVEMTTFCIMIQLNK